MNKEYYSILAAGFNQVNQTKIANLLEQIKYNYPNFHFYYQTAQSCEDISNAFNECFYTVCLIDSQLRNQDFQNQLLTQNKYTALIYINSQERQFQETLINTLNTINNHKFELIETELEHLDSYWLHHLIHNSIVVSNLHKEIKRLSHYDNLTGLVNRNLYQNHLNHALALSKRNNDFCTLIYLDINHFKNINTEYGAKTGDLVLIECAQRIKKSIRSTDIAARLGSDEFAILLESCTHEEAQRIISDLTQAMAIPFIINGSKIHIDCSIDNACYPDNCSDISLFLNEVREAHYLAKIN